LVDEQLALNACLRFPMTYIMLIVVTVEFANTASKLRNSAFM